MDSDEILEELRRCQNELRAVSAHNLAQLRRVLQVFWDHSAQKKFTFSAHGTLFFSFFFLQAAKEELARCLPSRGSYLEQRIATRNTLLKDHATKSKNQNIFFLPSSLQAKEQGSDCLQHCMDSV